MLNNYLKYETTNQVEIFFPKYNTVYKLYIGFSGDELTKTNDTRNDELYYNDRFFYDFYHSPTVEDAITGYLLGRAKSVRSKYCERSDLEKSSKNGYVYSAHLFLTEAFASVKTWAWGEKELYKIKFSRQLTNISTIKVMLQATLQ